MSEEENKEFMRNIYDEWNEVRGDVLRVRSLYSDKYRAPEFVFHHVTGGDMNRGKAMQYMMMMVSAIPDLEFAIDDMIAEGDKVVTRYTVRGTHKGTYMGVPATGQYGAFKGVEIDRIVGGKLVEIWDFPDSLSIMTQLGIVTRTDPRTS